MTREEKILRAVEFVITREYGLPSSALQAIDYRLKTQFLEFYGTHSPYLFLYTTIEQDVLCLLWFLEATRGEE